MPLEVVELPELETQRRDGVDEGGRPQTCTEVRFYGNALSEKGPCTLVLIIALMIVGFRISELEVEDENEIQWEDLAGGWSSVRSPQWLRSKWWSIKRQVSNHKDIPFSGTHKPPPV